MAAVPSTMLALDTPAPDFSLPDTRRGAAGAMVTRAQFSGRPLLVMFVCNHCPFVKHVRTQLALLGRDYAAKVGIVAINSNDPVNFPDDSPEKMAEEAQIAGYVFPYLFDATQAVAKAYRAACTPDFFLFDAHHRLAYRGQLDSSRPPRKTDAPGAVPIPVTGADLRRALDAVLAGRPVPEPHLPSVGCNIKWKVGSEPDYYRN